MTTAAAAADDDTVGYSAALLLYISRTVLTAHSHEFMDVEVITWLILCFIYCTEHDQQKPFCPHTSDIT
jgi:hypothetical protein